MAGAWWGSAATVSAEQAAHSSAAPPGAARPGTRAPSVRRLRTPSGDDARRCVACLCVAAGRRATGVAVASEEMAVVDGGGCEREASGGEYASRCAPCGVMHACIGDRAATGEAARYRCVRVVLVLFVACATVAPCHSRMAMYTLDIWTCCDYIIHGARSHSVAVWRLGRHWRRSPQCYQLIPCAVQNAPSAALYPRSPVYLYEFGIDCC